MSAGAEIPIFTRSPETSVMVISTPSPSISLLIPLIYVLPGLLENKVFAVFLAEPIADTIAVCTTVVLFIISFRKLKRTMG